MHTIMFPINELKIGGAEQQLLELVRGLDKTRFRPIVVPLYSGGALDPEFRAIDGVEVVHLNRRGKYDPSPLWRIATLLRRHRVDIIQPFLSPATFFSLPAALLMRTPGVIVTERCGVRKVRGFGYQVYRTIEDWLSRFADAIVPNSAAGRTMLLERGLPPHKTQVIYNGINLERLQVNGSAMAEHSKRLSAPDGGAVVGILASLTRPKGHDVLLRAIVELRDTRPGLRVAVIGDGPLRGDLEALADKLGLSDEVVFFGFQRNVAEFLCLCDVIVSASRDNEGCSNSILEAMALGVPVIATNVGGNQELIVDGLTGFLVPPDDHRALSQAIVRVLSNTTETVRCVHRARDLIRTRFSLKRMVADYEALYTNLIAIEQPDRQVADSDILPSSTTPAPGTNHSGSFVSAHSGNRIEDPHG